MTCGLWVAGDVQGGGGGRSANLLLESQRTRDTALVHLQALCEELSEYE
jgi:hypothetical protein